MPLTRDQGRAIWFLFTAFNVVLATVITYKRVMPSKRAAPDRNRVGFHINPSLEITDEELMETYDLTDRLREAQCLYSHGKDHHIQRAGQICDELLEHPGLPPTICVQVLILLMSIEPDTDTINELLQRAEGLYNIIYVCHTPGDNEIADNLIMAIRESLDIITKDQEKRLVDEEDSDGGQALWSDEEDAEAEEELEPEYWSDDSTAADDGKVEVSTLAGDGTVHEGKDDDGKDDQGKVDEGKVDEGKVDEESAVPGTSDDDGGDGKDHGLRDHLIPSPGDKIATYVKASSYKSDKPNEPRATEEQKKTEQEEDEAKTKKQVEEEEEEEAKADAKTQKRERTRRAIIAEAEERLRRKGWLGKDETILVPEKE